MEGKEELSSCSVGRLDENSVMVMKSISAATGLKNISVLKY